MATAGASEPRVRQRALRGLAVLSALSIGAATMVIVHRAEPARPFARIGDAWAVLTTAVLLTRVWTRRGPGVLVLLPCSALVAATVTATPRSDTAVCALYGWMVVTTAVICSEAATPALPQFEHRARSARHGLPCVGRLRAVAVPSGLAALGSAVAIIVAGVSTDPQYVWLVFGAVAFATLAELVRRALGAPRGAGPAGRRQD